MDPFSRDPFRQCDGGLAASERFEPPVEFDQLLGFETGADAARITQLALGVIVASEKRAKPLPAPFGIRVTDDDEFLAIAAFRFEPAAAPSRAVGIAPA